MEEADLRGRLNRRSNESYQRLTGLCTEENKGTMTGQINLSAQRMRTRGSKTRMIGIICKDSVNE